MKLGFVDVITRTGDQIAACVGNLVGPAGKDEREAATRMRHYLLTEVGRQHFLEVNLMATTEDIWSIIDLTHFQSRISSSALELPSTLPADGV